MIPVARAAAIYIFLLAAVRLSGKRTLGQVTLFDFVLLLIITEATQQAMTGADYSVTDAILIVATLVGLNRLSDLLSLRYSRIDRLLNDAPLVLIDRGEVLDDRLRFGHVKRDDILEEARKTQGLARLDQIEYAVLERSGTISIIPRRRPEP
jgi:uncharacterized membrane protein YcaP (DUF421 family)